MTATHKFPMPTVSFDLTTSAGPASSAELLEPLALVHGQPGAAPLVTFGLPHPVRSVSSE